MRGVEVGAGCGLLLPDVVKLLTGQHEIEQLLSLPALGSPWAVHVWAGLKVRSCPVCGGDSCVGHTLLPGAFSVRASVPEAVPQRAHLQLWVAYRECCI